MKHARRLATRAFRAKANEFLAEGPQAVREALAHPVPPLEVFATVDATQRHPELEAAARTADVEWHVVDDDVVAEIADAVSPQGVVARCPSLLRGIETLPDPARLVVVCHEIRDPGNVGAVIRCADAVGADAVVLTGDSVDPQGPKAVRASAGSLFHLPVLVHRDHEEVVTLAWERGLQVLAADGGGDRGLFDVELDLSRPTVWVMGNEARGMTDDVRAAADHVVSVPILGRAESLNLATAAAVCLYASARALLN